MNIYIAVLFIFLLLMPGNSLSVQWQEDCLRHNSTCIDKCYESFDNVKEKSDTTRKYLERCLSICERHKRYCIERIERVISRQEQDAVPEGPSFHERLNNSTSINSENSNEIYKYRDENGQLHVVDDIEKVPPEYR